MMPCTRRELVVSGRVRTGFWQLAFTQYKNGMRPCALLSLTTLAADSVRGGEAL